MKTLLSVILFAITMFVAGLTSSFEGLYVPLSEFPTPTSTTMPTTIQPPTTTSTTMMSEGSSISLTIEEYGEDLAIEILDATGRDWQRYVSRIVVAENFDYVWANGCSLDGEVCTTDQVYGVYTTGDNTIYMNVDYVHDYEQFRDTLYHELSHAYQDYMGLPLDEHDADCYARALGAENFSYGCSY